MVPLATDVVLDHVEHRVTVVGLDPPLNLVEDNESRSLALNVNGEDVTPSIIPPALE
jgi:hypothetical protein